MRSFKKTTLKEINDNLNLLNDYKKKIMCELSDQSNSFTKRRSNNITRDKY